MFKKPLTIYTHSEEVDKIKLFIWQTFQPAYTLFLSQWFFSLRNDQSKIIQIMDKQFENESKMCEGGFQYRVMFTCVRA